MHTMMNAIPERSNHQHQTRERISKDLQPELSYNSDVAFVQFRLKRDKGPGVAGPISDRMWFAITQKTHGFSMEAYHGIPSICNIQENRSGKSVIASCKLEKQGAGARGSVARFQSVAASRMRTDSPPCVGL